MFHTLLITIVAILTSIIGFFSPVQHQTSTPVTSLATTTITATTTPMTAETSVIATTTIAHPTPKKIARTPTISPAIHTSAPITPTVVTPAPDFTQINTSARSTLVNILCTTQSGGTFSPISGSGVIISPDGVIITNAHVAQYYLLTNFDGRKDFIQCVIRSGSPAYPKYLAKLVYISPTWVADNSTLLTQEDPKGTGEHDYAFLKIISDIRGLPVTKLIPYLIPNTTANVRTGDTMLLASYPAEFLGGISISNDLYPSTAITRVGDVYTFSDSTTDLISVPGTVVSQKGSSGGAVVNGDSQLEGIISTSSGNTTTGARDLRAITLDYINRDLQDKEGFDLTHIRQDADAVSVDFADIATHLTQMLTDGILKK